MLEELKQQRQKIFETAVRGLLSQDGPSLGIDNYGKDICAYRGKDGRKCAIGHCIPDDVYSSDMENLRVIALLRNENIARILPSDSCNFLTAIQSQLHDIYFNNGYDIPWKEWVKNATKDFAENSIEYYQLNTDFLNNKE